MLRKVFNTRSLFFCVATFSIFASSVFAQNDFKQLAGPSEEISSMQLPAPSMNGQRSKAAMIPIMPTGERGSWSVRIPVDSAEDVKLLFISPNSQDWNIRLAMPNEKFINLRQDGYARGIESGQSTFGFDGDNFPSEVFTFDNAKRGIWTIQITTNQRAENREKPAGYLVVSSKSPYRLYSYVNTFETVVGKPIGLFASLFDDRVSSESVQPQVLRGTIKKAVMAIETPTGNIERYSLFNNHDVLGNSFIPSAAGKYLVQITVNGMTPEGTSFIRTSEHLIQVADKGGKIGTAVSNITREDLHLRLDLPVKGLSVGQRVICYAEVWGRDEKGNSKAIAWIGGMSLVENANERGRTKTVVPFSLDARWLARESNLTNYTLKNVRLQDPDYSTVLATSDEVSLSSFDMPEMKGVEFNQITDEMRMGKRPANLPKQTEAPGGKLLLVHGYCSGGNTFPTSQFTNYAVFSDPNKNRTHDQFANLIKNFGAQFPSFGIVAHSQGGAASLHLYTYYWSGLDSATGTRLIQSVGTPYQGTALAGNLALLGQIFGAGCGSNYDLSYGGAAAWLSGIPSWARAKVYYHTTSFTDVWWRYDYCNLATDVFLGDPEDGVVEQSKGQLSGANNLGHKTGWCHTSGMRDPAQTSDSSRNANMNANAAR